MMLMEVCDLKCEQKCVTTKITRSSASFHEFARGRARTGQVPMGSQ